MICSRLYSTRLFFYDFDVSLSYFNAFDSYRITDIVHFIDFNQFISEGLMHHVRYNIKTLINH